MPFVLRDDNGKLYRVTSRAIPGAELLPTDHPDVLAFLEARGVSPEVVRNAFSELRRTDNEMSRAVEDVITVLLKKNILKMNDLPKAVQDRIALRVRMRMQIQEAYDRASATQTRTSPGEVPDVSADEAVLRLLTNPR